ncbi:P-type type IV conjugative transfer system translocation pore protein TrbG/VirB9 [Campylobacter blaseri]|uniref:Type IV secretion system protein VirB9 n=1 Tax=Campylobacter blaseri TaxID=2042961 RepID=A0A2P8QYD2_9BACT|nr:TrbG/VirB9 family P-type conjugative transfer protein [Campylobacter blaseri]PSM51254.1 type IV secretion system protein VirB9 [Campylobacter blaseri]PSM52398.1 type IV secretion system protein VirB9 [Campylobacter blaseri]QKF86589.1 P-type type IV conjugative transfer system translocation pore protein TrbG/VirB9 [Campylobacter blaseri]
MKNLTKIYIILATALNLNAQGLSEEQMSEVRAIMRQTQELVNEQKQQDQSMGENIFNDKTKNINKNIQTSVGINPFGVYGQKNYQEHPQDEYINFDGSTSQEPREYSKEEMELMRNAIRNQDLKALQKKFHSKKYSGFENTKTIKYTPNKTHKIRTRHAMATTLIFDSPIENFILGDQTGFKLELIPNKDDAIAVIPQLIGIDTSLTIFTRDGKIHTFYIFSTDYKNTKDPSFVIYMKDEEAIRAKQAKIERDNRDYKIIQDGIAELKIKKSDIYNGYIQKANKENEWLLSAEIFDDKKFTYFKYPKDELPQVPAIFAVIDNQDSPVETRVIGDYIIAETINPRFTIKSGNSYICVGRKETKEEKDRKEMRKNLNISKEAIKERQKVNKEKQNQAINRIKGI